MYKIELHQSALLQKGKRLHIDMDISIFCRQINPDGCVVVTPLLSSGNHSQELPLVIINGKQRHRNFKHMIAYLKDYHIYKEMLGINDSSLWCSYKLHIPYQDWMCEAELSLIAN